MKHTKKIIGLTGPTGAGKSTAGAVFSQNGATILDCDEIARLVVMPGEKAWEEIKAYFGEDVLCADGSINRKKLGGIVFSNSEKCRKLNEITHKYITETLLHRMEDIQGTVVIDAPLLYEAGLDHMCDAVIAVIAPQELRKNRIMIRDDMTSQAAQSRINAQASNAIYAQKADYVIENNGDLMDFITACEKIWRMICEKT